MQMRRCGDNAEDHFRRFLPTANASGTFDTLPDASRSAQMPRQGKKPSRKRGAAIATLLTEPAIT
jgi:hypothetical protein